MLKHNIFLLGYNSKYPAAFRRLCVETVYLSNYRSPVVPAAFRRLCVETSINLSDFFFTRPAAFRRLCVETTLRCLA